MNQAALPVLPSFLIYVRNLLETRMKVTTYNHHARLLLPSPWSFSSNQCIRAEGADAVMKSVNYGLTSLKLLNSRISFRELRFPIERSHSPHTFRDFR